MDESSEPEVLASEAGRMTGYSAQMIRWLVDQGRLRARRGPGGIRLIDRAAVEKLARDRRIESISPKTSSVKELRDARPARDRGAARIP